MHTFVDGTRPAAGARRDVPPPPTAHPPVPRPRASPAAAGHAFARTPVVHGALPATGRPLPVNAPGDLHEQEAEGIAARVMRHPAPPERVSPAPVRVQSRGDGGNGSGGSAAPAAVHEVLASPGRPLAPATRATMEARFGHDFGRVRVHADGAAARSARAVGALAYTVGTDVVFGAGRYAPGSPGGDRLIAHELVHVLQQQGAPPRVQRQAPPAAEEKKDPELELGEALRSPQGSDGMTLAFYDQDEPEAKGRAADFATRENALGPKKGTAITAANLGFGRAISGVQSVETTVPAIAKVAREAIARVPARPGLPPESVAQPAKVRTLAIFAHGTPTWCSLAITTSNAPKIFKAIAPDLSPRVHVILYTCNSARGPSEDEEWVKGTMRPGGKGSLGATVRDVLADEKVDAGSVWGHTTTGHTSRNFALREFSVREGKGAEGQSYVSKYIFTDTERTAAIADLAADINGMGYSVSAGDAAFVKAATAVLEGVFYSAYAEANRKLPGENVAEEAPVYPYSTAARVEKYWKDTYWPANRAAAAAKLVKRMKLKKTAAP